jgi:hypothetical protein
MMGSQSIEVRRLRRPQFKLLRASRNIVYTLGQHAE